MNLRELIEEAENWASNANLPNKTVERVLHTSHWAVSALEQDPPDYRTLLNSLRTINRIIDDLDSPWAEVYEVASDLAHKKMVLKSPYSK